MQILKSKKDRMGTFNRYVPNNPHEQVMNIDTLIARNQAYGRMSTDFTNEEGKSATEVYNETLDKEVDNIIARYPPIFARGGEFGNLVIINQNLIAWNREALDIFIHAGYPQSFNRFRRVIETALLKWAGVDTSLLDGETWKIAVDRCLTEFAFKYLSSENNNED